MKGNKKLRVIVAMLFAALIILVFNYAIKERQEYLYKKNTYTANDIELDSFQTVKVSDKIVDYLPDTVTETNLLGEVRSFDIEIEVDGVVEEIGEEEYFFSFMSDEKEEFLKSNKVVVALVNEERDYRQEIEFFVTYYGLRIVPLVLNSESDVENIHVEIEEINGSFSIKLEASDAMKKGIKSFLDSEVLLGVYYGEGKLLKLVNKDLLKLTDAQILSRAFDDSWAGEDSRWTEYIKAEYLKLPKELLEIAFQENLVVSIEDFNKTITKYDVADSERFYNEGFTKQSYVSNVIAHYTNSKKKITFNSSQRRSVFNPTFINKVFDEGKFYPADDFKDYEIYVYGSKKDSLNNSDEILFYLKNKLKHVLYHEFGHFLYDNSSYTLGFTNDEMVSLTSKFDYCYNNLFDSEIIAYGFSIYFANEEFVKEHLPEMEREIELVLRDMLANDKIEALKIIEENETKGKSVDFMPMKYREEDIIEAL